MMKMIRILLGTAVICSSALGGDAVSGLNGKAAIFGGDMGGDSGLNIDGSISAPVSDQFGVQLDGLYSDVADADYYGIGGHLFWRNSDIGLLGLTAGAMRENDVVDSWAAGFEGEYYLEWITLNASAGAASIDYAFGPLPDFETDKQDYYLTAGLGYYFTENLLGAVDGTYAFNNGLGRGEVEYLTPYAGMSLIADVAYGANDYYHVMGGLRFYFGESKSLLYRHREDDPGSVLYGMMYNLGTYGADRNASSIAENSDGAYDAPAPTPVINN